jgi:hypothetical protein
MLPPHSSYLACPANSWAVVLLAAIFTHESMHFVLAIIGVPNDGTKPNTSQKNRVRGKIWFGTHWHYTKHRLNTSHSWPERFGCQELTVNHFVVKTKKWKVHIMFLLVNIYQNNEIWFREMTKIAES